MRRAERRPIRRGRKPPARNLTRDWAQKLVQNEEKHDGYRNKTLGCSSSGELVGVSCHWAVGAGRFVARSGRMAPPEKLNQSTARSSQLLPIAQAKGNDIHKLRQ